MTVPFQGLAIQMAPCTRLYSETKWEIRRTSQNFKNVHKPDGNTTLSTHSWKEKEEVGDSKIEWKILEKNIPTFNPVTKICKLCLREKFNIVMRPSLATLNSRQEIFAHCRHKTLKLIGQPPD